MRAVVKNHQEASQISLDFGENLYTGINSFVEFFSESTTLEKDILNVAATIYAADLAVKRNDLEEYVRSIEIDIEVINYQAFERIKEDLITALFILSNDNWTINFIPKIGSPEELREWESSDGVVLLFSGGLDSFCGAVHYLENQNRVALVSHVNQNKVVSTSQKAVLKSLIEQYNPDLLEHYPYRVFGRNKGIYRFPSDSERENTQRTRSFLFVALAAITARRTGMRKIISMAENGQFAIHLPLTQARSGPFSTHTANPMFLKIAEKVFKELLNYSTLEIENPFIYQTKAEVISILNKSLLDRVESSVSCWMASRLGTKNHCGECIPCISRRIGLEYNGVVKDEYENDIWSTDLNNLSPDDTSKRNLTDYLEFISIFKDYDSNRRDEILSEFYELVNEAFDTDRAIEMYSRMAEQSYAVFEKYPHIKKIMG